MYTKNIENVIFRHSKNIQKILNIYRILQNIFKTS